MTDSIKELAEKIYDEIDTGCGCCQDSSRSEDILKIMPILREAMEQQRWELLNKHLDEFMNEAMQQRIKDAYTRAAEVAIKHYETCKKWHLGNCGQDIAAAIEKLGEETK